MKSGAFIDSVRREFAPLAEKHGLRELGTKETYAYKAIAYTNGERAVQFDLDVRDGYLDVYYPVASIYLTKRGLAAPTMHDYTQFMHDYNRKRSVKHLLNAEGIFWPDREGGLYDPGVLEKALHDLIEGMDRHSEEVFGR